MVREWHCVVSVCAKIPVFNGKQNEPARQGGAFSQLEGFKSEISLISGGSGKTWLQLKHGLPGSSLSDPIKGGVKIINMSGSPTGICSSS